MSNLDKFKEAIKKAKENKGRQEGLQFEFEGVEPGSWSDFLIKTDIGQIIAQNEQVNFKDSYGRRTRGAFIKLDENTFAQVSLLGSGRSSESHIGITFFPKEELEARTEILIDYDNPNFSKDLQASRKSLLEFQDFNFEDKRKERLFEKLKDIKRNGTNPVISNSDIDLAFDMISNGELAWNWLGDEILCTSQFKNNLINFIINESPKNEECGRFIEELISMNDGDFLKHHNYFFDEDILENKEFIDNLNEKYFNGQNYYYGDISKYESGTEAIIFSIYSKYSKDGSFENPEFLEEKIDLICKLAKENDGDLGFLKGVIPYIVEENPELVDKIFSISTDPEIISKILETAPDSTFKNPEFLKKTLAVTTDKKHIEKVLAKMSAEDKINPEMMLGIVESCPNVLGVFKEIYNSWTDSRGNRRENLFYELQTNEDFQKGLFEMCREFISQSEIESYTTREGVYRTGHIGRKTFYSEGYDVKKYRFKEDTPMAEYEEKMNSDTKDILLDITSQWFIKQQSQLETPQFSEDEILDIKYEGKYGGGGFVSAAIKAREIINNKEDKGLTFQEIGKGTIEAFKDNPGEATKASQALEQETKIHDGEKNKGTTQGEE